MVNPIRGSHLSPHSSSEEFRVRSGELARRATTLSGLAETFGTSVGFRLLMQPITGGFQRIATGLNPRSFSGFFITFSLASAAFAAGLQVAFQKIGSTSPRDKGLLSLYAAAFLQNLPSTLLMTFVGFRFGWGATVLQDLITEPFQAGLYIASRRFLGMAGLTAVTSMSLSEELSVETVEGWLGSTGHRVGGLLPEPSAMLAMGGFFVAGIGRMIPTTMATPHPDNHAAPEWGKSPFVSALDEVRECRAVYGHGMGEFELNSEGKLLERDMVLRLLQADPDYFRENQLGRDRFLTFRLPHAVSERRYRMAAAFLTMVESGHIAVDHGVHPHPLFEGILPMTESAQQLLATLRFYREVAQCERRIYGKEVAGKEGLELIPLLERVDTLFRVEEILRKYAQGYRRLTGHPLASLRVFIARSDPALGDGYPAAVLAARAAISECYRFQEFSEIPTFPIIGIGSPHFRGGLTPATVRETLATYAGARTVTVQSANRYDHPRQEVTTMVDRLNRELPTTDPVRFAPEEVARMRELADTFSSFYRRTIAGLAPTIREWAKFVPSHRERVPDSGQFGYARPMEGGEVVLPRAIKFTAACYSMGIPPELIGTGRALEAIAAQGRLEELLRFLPNLKSDLQASGGFLCRDNLQRLAAQEVAWREVLEDVERIERIFGIELAPQGANQSLHNSQAAINFILGSQPERNHGELDAGILIAARARSFLG